jgi:hypothetical protein
METVNVQTPEMVRKEIGVHCLAYNLLRTLMWQATQSAQVKALRISLQGTRQLFRNHLTALANACETKRKRLYQTLLEVITHELWPWPPYRSEPRVNMQRPKPFTRMQESKDVLKAKMVA